MDESALRTSLAILEMQRASLVPLLELSTRLVVVGLFVDAFVILGEYWHGLREFWRGIIHSPEKPSGFLLFLGLLGVVLIAGGVAGELVFQAKIGTIETEMRLTSDRIVVLVSQAAGKAQRSAHDAAADAQTAREQADAAIGDANRGRRVVNEVVEAVKCPTLTQKQQDAIADAARPFASRDIHVLVKFTAGCGMSLGVQINAALDKAGFSMDEPQPFPYVWFGLSVEAPRSLIFKAAKVAGAVMQKGNLPMWGGIAPLPDGSPIVITVGEHQPGRLPDLTSPAATVGARTRAQSKQTREK